MSAAPPRARENAMYEGRNDRQAGDAEKRLARTLSPFFCGRWLAAVFVVATGCGAPADNAVDEPADTGADRPIVAENAGGESVEQEDPVIARLKEIEAELNREAHDHSICDEALELAEQALRDNPDLALAYAVRADVQQEHGETTEACRNYKKAYQLDRDNPMYGRKLAVSYEAREEWDEALDVWKDLCRRFPNEWSHFFGRGAVYAHLGRDEEAAADYKRAERLQRRQ